MPGFRVYMFGSSPFPVPAAEVERGMSRSSNGKRGLLNSSESRTRLNLGDTLLRPDHFTALNGQLLFLANLKNKLLGNGESQNATSSLALRNGH